METADSLLKKAPSLEVKEWAVDGVSYVGNRLDWGVSHHARRLRVEILNVAHCRRLTESKLVGSTLMRPGLAVRVHDEDPEHTDNVALWAYRSSTGDEISYSGSRGIHEVTQRAMEARLASRQGGALGTILGFWRRGGGSL